LAWCGKAHRLTAEFSDGYQPAMQTVALWKRWMGEKVHPLRLTVEVGCALIALWQISILASVFLKRFSYPIDLEWCEGGSLYQAQRLLQGLSVYRQDDPNWAPFPYPPAHTLLLALVGLVRLDFWSGRLVSIAFFALLCVTVFRQIYKHLDGSCFGVAAGLLAVATIVCGFPVVGQFYDLVRVDTMMLALSVWSVARVDRANMQPRQLLITSAILCAAVFAKQTAIFFVGWAGLFALIHRPRFGWRLALISGGLGLLLLGLGQWVTSGGLWFWTVAGIEGHSVEDPRIMQGIREVWRYAPFIAALPIALLILALRGYLSPRTVLWSGCLIFAVPASLLPYAKVGGYDNNLMPLIVFVGPTTALMIADLAKQRALVGPIARWGLLIGLTAFVYCRPLKPLAYLPDPQKVRAATELNALVASLDGGVVVPYLAFLPGHNGHKNRHWHSMIVWDAVWRGQPWSEVRALDATGAHWVLLHSKDIGEFANYARRTSTLIRRLPDSARVHMVTGSAVEIDEVWKRNLPLPH
jgi:hypothetical protein